MSRCGEIWQTALNRSFCFVCLGEGGGTRLHTAATGYCGFQTLLSSCWWPTILAQKPNGQRKNRSDPIGCQTALNSCYPERRCTLHSGAKEAHRRIHARMDGGLRDREKCSRTPGDLAGLRWRLRALGFPECRHASSISRERSHSADIQANTGKTIAGSPGSSAHPAKVVGPVTTTR